MMSKILVVDDEEKIRKLLAMMLSDESYQVTVVGSTAEALRTFKDVPHDAVITDIKMPGEDGLQLLAKIKSIDAFVPVILITGHGDKQAAIDALRGGAFDFIEKPFSDEEILVSLKKALDYRYLTIKYEISRQRLDRRTERLVKLCEIEGPLSDLQGKVFQLQELLDEDPLSMDLARETTMAIQKMAQGMREVVKRNKV